MKIFVPLSDSLLQNGALGREKLVPFDPKYMIGAAVINAESVTSLNKGVKPRNWIEESDYTQACERLRLMA